VWPVMADTTGLIGRTDELARLGALLDAVPAGGSSLLVRGDAGIGKSALVAAAAADAAARGWRVLRVEGAQGEALLPLAALHRLLLPVLGEVGALPAGERDALLGAFGLAEVSVPEIYRLALAVLNLLTEIAVVAPVVVVVEDTHWLDRSTAAVLAFVARRVAADPVLLLASARPGEDDEPIAEAVAAVLEPAPLDGDAAAALLERSGGDALDPARRAAVLAAAQGNPLALVELPRALLAGGAWAAGEELPMTDRLERAFADRLGELPEATGTAVLLAALAGDMDAVAARAAAGGDDLAPAVAAGLIERDAAGRVRFRHPLVRSAVARAAPVDRRMAAHAALAAVPGEDPDRRAWHRANATLGADESVAADLQAVARRAQRRGAIADAVSALERAADFSGADERRTQRLLHAAELAAEIGQVAAIRRVEAAVDLPELTGSDRLRLEAVREAVDYDMSSAGERVDQLIELADTAQSGGLDDLARRFLVQAAFRCWIVDFGGAREARVVTAVERVVGDAFDPRGVVARAYAAPLDQAATVLASVSDPELVATADPVGLHLLGHAASCVGEFHVAARLCGAAVDGLRAEGRLTTLTQALRIQAWAALRIGHWDVCATAATEAVRLTHETRQPLVRADLLSALAALAALRGDLERAAALAADAEALALGTGNHVTLSTIESGRAAAAAGDGRSGDAFDILIRVFRPGEPVHQRMQAVWATGALTEYAVLSGHDDAARAEVAALEARAAGRALSSGVAISLRHARALLAEPDEAEARFQDALDPALGAWPFDSARIRLSYGAWLRRQRRVVDSRAPLRAARDAFDRLGASGWADRARVELAAAGEDSTRRAPEAWDELTPQEVQVAQMVAQGLSNKEIGQRLYVSHRTVASHLYRMFPKLGVTSRAQIARAVAERERA
jgi:DNA-binding CsgD family transcriptional regulator